MARQPQARVLAPCPNKPNCVSTTAVATEQQMPAIPITADLAMVAAAIKRVCLSEPRVELLKEERDFLHFAFKSRLFGFVDDVEFLLDPQAKVVHFRSASRVGYSDLGANRQRMTHLSARIQQELAIK